MLIRSAIILVLLGFGVGCSEPRERAAGQINDATAKELRWEAARLYKQLRSSPGPNYIPLKRSAWPAAFLRFKPKRIGVYIDGVALALEGDAASEQGLHIVPKGMEFTPPAGRARFEPVRDGIYWYSLGK